MGENKIITCGISGNMMWNDAPDFWANSTGNHGPEARDFAASVREMMGLGIKQCSEMGFVFCGEETGQDRTTEAGGRTAGQASNNFFATIIRAHRYR